MNAVDLFAGAGGFTTGAVMAGCRVVWAANHWPAAVQVHANNHPDTEHVCQDLQQADWGLVPDHDILLASWACQGFSRARGKDRPRHDAVRSTAWAVVSALEAKRPASFVGENVVEFASWVLYEAWCAAIHALGYAMTPMVLDAADHGVPQHRRRLFIVGTRSKHSITLDLPRREHVGARSAIDFGRGEWTRVVDKVPATRARVCAARARFGSRFVMPYYGSGSGLTGRDLGRPIGTITTKNRWGVVDGNRMRMLAADETRACMGFPDGYLLPAGITEATFMLGNAVCPPVARDLINAIREAA